MSELTAGTETQASKLPRQEQRSEEEERVELLVTARIAELSSEMADVVVAAGKGCWSSVLTSAASLGKEELLGALLKQPRRRPAIGSSSKDMSGAVLAAANKGQPQCLRLLLEACASSSPTAVTELLQARDAWGDTPLLLATRHGHVECLRLLLQHSPEVQVAATATAKVNYGDTPLLLAARRGNPACLQLLLEHCPEVELTPHGDSALVLAAGSSNASVDCLKLLLARHPSQQQQLDKALLRACGNLAHMKAAAAGSATSAKQQALKQCVQLLLGKGAELDRSASQEVFAAFWPICKELVARALVPDMANEAVLGLALAATALRKRRASGEEAAGPAKRTCPSP